MGVVSLNKKQGRAWRILDDKTTTEVLYGGGAGSGKSWLGALWLFTNCIRYPGSRWLMGRAVLKTLKETTLNSFFDVCSHEGLKSGVHYTYNAQTSQITVGQSTIILKDLFAYPADPNFDDLGSLEITGAFIDEANQITAKAKAIVGSRMRYKLDEFGLVPKLLMTCNPAKNWVYSDFYRPWRDGNLEPHRAFVQALVTDNPNISPHYIANLEKLTGTDRARLLLGDWDYDDAPDALMGSEAISDLWANIHVQGGAKAISADVARYGSDRTVVGLWDGLRLVELFTYQGKSVPEVAAAITQLQKQEGVPRSRIVVDDDGIGGGVVDLLPGCMPFNGGSRPIDVAGKPTNFANIKAQCSYALADHVNDRAIYIETQREAEPLKVELSWMRRWKMDQDGKLRVWPKEEVKKGLGRSPDIADMVMMRMLLELKATPGVSLDLLANRGRKVRTDAVRRELRRRWRT